MTRPELATKAITEALRVRLRAGVQLIDPASPVDIAEKLGVQVWFRRLPSAEGFMLRAGHPVILLSALRHNGRISFTCAHELGHFWLGHSAHIDGLSDGPMLSEDDDDEFQANQFAAYLLMPKSTVQRGFHQRGKAPETASPWTVLAVAHWLGVGYSALVHHLDWNLRLITRGRADELLRERPGEIVAAIVPARPPGTSSFVVDKAWRSRAVDLEVGDLAILDQPVAIAGDAVVGRESLGGKFIVEAVRPGIAHLDADDGWAAYVRVRRHRFEGRATFRHMAETDDE